MRIIDFFDRGAQLYPDNIAFVDGPERMSYQQAHEQTLQVANAIRGHGLRSGTKVAVLAPNSNSAFIALLSSLRAGLVWLPINPRNTVATNIDLLDRFDGEFLFYHSSFEEEAAEILAKVPAIKGAVCLDREGAQSPSLKAWIEGFAPQFEMPRENPDDLIAIFPTGGTTGPSKGVMMTHRMIETLFAGFHTHMNFDEGSAHLVVAPMTHTAGLLGCLHFPRGGTNVMMSKVDPRSVMESIQEHRITHLFLPPTVIHMMLSDERVKDFDYRSLCHFIYGAAPMPTAKLKEAHEIFGPVMTEIYGQVEFPAILCCKVPADYIDADGALIESRLRSVGRASLYTRAEIMDDEGKIMPPGERGEIVARGSLTLKGYYKNPEASAEAGEFGWHHTGDIGIKDKDGFITIVDRKKDMIITGGFNVYPNEVEQVLSQLPGVQECSVIGIPDEKWGEAVKACVLMKPGQSLSEDQIIAHCKEQMGGVKAPKSVDFMDDLPRSPAGKVLKTELRKRYWDGHESSLI